MSEQPEKRNKDSKRVSEESIEQPEPIGKQDPTEPVTVGGGKGSSGREGKASGGAQGV